MNMIIKEAPYFFGPSVYDDDGGGGGSLHTVKR